RLRQVEGMLKRYYPPRTDPYRLFEREIGSHLQPNHTLLDAGCGRKAALLNFLAPRVVRAIGQDLVEFDASFGAGRVLLFRADLARVPLEPCSVDIVISRSVVEHLAEPAAVYRQIHRVLRPGGKFIFITPNVWSYPIIAARLIPNRLHAAVVGWAEGRPEADTFATHHRSNSMRAIRKLAAATGFEVITLQYLSMFPNYLMFHPLAFLAGVGYERLVRRVRPLRFLQHWILATLAKRDTGGPEDSAISDGSRPASIP
ncbi:MAG: class I SAM-dependent methyltransferase, partial [Terriglobia bacterium]